MLRDTLKCIDEMKDVREGDEIVSHDEEPLQMDAMGVGQIEERPLAPPTLVDAQSVLDYDLTDSENGEFDLIEESRATSPAGKTLGGIGEESPLAQRLSGSMKKTKDNL